MLSVACEMPFYGTGDCNMLSQKKGAADLELLWTFGIWLALAEAAAGRPCKPRGCVAQ